MISDNFFSKKDRMIFCLIFQAPYFLVLAISASNRNSCKRRRRVVGIAVGVVAVVKVDFDDVVVVGVVAVIMVV